MATPGRGKDPPVAHRLFEAPYEFDFFQAVRLLERLADAEGSVGRDSLGREPVRFAVHQDLAFPASAIHDLRPGATGEDAQAVKPGHTAPAVMTIAFFGLTGPLGVLPLSYSTILRERLAAGDSSTPDFFDLFNHRLISLFYRAWDKYRVARTIHDHESGSFIRALYSLIGLGGPAPRGRLPFTDAALLYRANLFSPQRRTAEGLVTILVDTLRLPIVVEQMVGRWVLIEPAERSRLGKSPGLRTLGEGFVLGRRIFEEQSKFRLQIGPLTFAEFRRLLPGEPLFRSLVALTRLYVGPEFEFDLSLILKAEEVPKCALGAGSSSSQLGRFSWVRSRGPLEDCAAVFRAAMSENE